MAWTTAEIAKVLKIDHSQVDELASYLFPMKLLFSREDILVIRDYYVKYGVPEKQITDSPFDEYMKLEKIAAILEARLTLLRERQVDCFLRLNDLKKAYQESYEKARAPVQTPVTSKGFMKKTDSTINVGFPYRSQRGR